MMERSWPRRRSSLDHYPERLGFPQTDWEKNWVQRKWRRDFVFWQSYTGSWLERPSSPESIESWHQNNKGFVTGDRKRCENTCRSLSAEYSTILFLARQTDNWVCNWGGSAPSIWNIISGHPLAIDNRTSSRGVVGERSKEVVES